MTTPGESAEAGSDDHRATASTPVHWVDLPYPDQQEPTVGSCRCGWAVIYSFGGHAPATAAAEQHVAAITGMVPYTLTTPEGRHRVHSSEISLWSSTDESEENE